MARKKKPAEHENLERWLVSYADFITLLFAFFVVMYSVSAVNQGKYRVLSDALVASFRSPLKSNEPIQMGDPAKTIYNPKVAFMRAPSVFNIPKMPQRTLPGNELEGEEVRGEGGVDVGVEGRGVEGLQVAEPDLEGRQRGVVSTKGDIVEGFPPLLSEVPPTMEAAGAPSAAGMNAGGIEGSGPSLPETLQESKAQQAVRSIAEEVGEALQALVGSGLVEVRRDDAALRVEVEIKDNFLFKSGSAKVDPQAIPVINQLADILKNFPYPIRVAGFTDTVPIDTALFPSNWELSAVRAASVVHVLSAAGIEPARLSAVGYGEHRPIAPNDTAAGRQKNRRVVLLIEANPAAQEILQASLPTVPRTDTFNRDSVPLPAAASPPEVVQPAPEQTGAPVPADNGVAPEAAGSAAPPSEPASPVPAQVPRHEKPAGRREPGTASKPAVSPEAIRGQTPDDATPSPRSPATPAGRAEPESAARPVKRGRLPGEPVDVTDRPGLERGDFPVIVLPEITADMVEEPVAPAPQAEPVKPVRKPLPPPPKRPDAPPPAAPGSAIELPNVAPIGSPIGLPPPAVPNVIPNPGGIKSIWPRRGDTDGED